jgi:hypothetical protein
VGDNTLLAIALVVRAGGVGSGGGGAALFPNESFDLLAFLSVAGGGGMTATASAAGGVCRRHVWRDSWRAGVCNASASMFSLSSGTSRSQRAWWRPCPCARRACIALSRSDSSSPCRAQPPPSPRAPPPSQARRCLRELWKAPAPPAQAPRLRKSDAPHESVHMQSAGARSAGMQSAGKVEPTHEMGRETEREREPALASGCACIELVEMTRR